MTDVSTVRSLAERLANIAADCFDLKAAQRLRELAEELLDRNRNIRTERNGATDGEDAAPA
jgi:hypothetical protein